MDLNMCCSTTVPKSWCRLFCIFFSSCVSFFPEKEMLCIFHHILLTSFSKERAPYIEGLMISKFHSEELVLYIFKPHALQ